MAGAKNPTRPVRPWTVLPGGVVGGAFGQAGLGAPDALTLLPPPASSGDLVDRLLHLVSQGTFACSPQGQIIFANAALCRLLGEHSTAELAGRTARWIAPRDGDGTFWDRLSPDGVAAPIEVWVRRRDGTQVAAEARGRAVRSADGAIVGFEGVITPAPASSPQTRQIGRLKTRLRRHAARARAERIEERRTLARRLHDDLGQTLVVVKLELERLVALPVTASAGLASERRSLNALRTWADEALQVVRTLCFELREVASNPLDLVALIEPLTHDLKRRWKLRTRVVGPATRVRLEGRRAMLVAEICREALTNVVRHAHATEVTVRVQAAGRSLTVTVTDNGRGFSADAIERRDSFGVLGMRERAQTLGGVLEIVRRGDATVVSLSIPIVKSPTARPPVKNRDQSPHRR